MGKSKSYVYLRMHGVSYKVTCRKFMNIYGEYFWEASTPEYSGYGKGETAKEATHYLYTKMLGYKSPRTRASIV